jgi:hypothetical protein
MPRFDERSADCMDGDAAIDIDANVALHCLIVQVVDRERGGLRPSCVVSIVYGDRQASTAAPLIAHRWQQVTKIDRHNQWIAGA